MVIRKKMSIQFSLLTERFPQYYGNFEEKKLAAVSRQTPENTRNSQSKNTLDPEMAQEYISQVSGEIEGRVTEKLSKEFIPTESRFIGCSV